MSFATLMHTRQLPERAWKLDAVVRLGASIIICILVGAVIGTAFRYFASPQKTSEVLFLVPIVAALALFAVAIVVLARPWPLERYMLNLVILLACVYGGFLLMWWGEHFIKEKVDFQSSVARMIIGVLAFQGAALVLVHFFAREHGMTWSEAFGFDNNAGNAAALGVCVGMISLPAIWGLQWLSATLLQRIALPAHEQETVHILRSTEGWPDRLVLGIVTIVLAPLAEEILFRGILYPTIKRFGFPRLAWWSTAILFGAIHLNLATFVPLTFLAFVLIWLYEHTGNLLACILTHSLFNTINFVLLYLAQDKL
jgi:membrane protease YdiL (CAAX protease family)